MKQFLARAYGNDGVGVLLTSEKTLAEALLKAVYYYFSPTYADSNVGVTLLEDSEELILFHMVKGCINLYNMDRLNMDERLLMKLAKNDVVGKESMTVKPLNYNKLIYAEDYVYPFLEV